MRPCIHTAQQESDEQPPLRKYTMKFLRPSIIGVLVATAALTASTAQATQLLYYDFASSLDPTSTEANMTGTGVNLTGSSAEALNANGLPFFLVGGIGYNIPTDTGGNPLATDAASAVAGNTYFQFSFEPSAGYQLDLTEFTFKGATTKDAGTNGYVVRSSVDSFGTDLSTSNFATKQPAFTTYSVPLGASFQGLTGSTTFRVYTYITSGSNIGALYDDLTVSGTVQAVPEPSTLATITAGFVSLTVGGYVRRRRRT